MATNTVGYTRKVHPFVGTRYFIKRFREEAEKFIEWNASEGGYKIRTKGPNASRPYWQKIVKNNQYVDIVIKSKEKAITFAAEHNLK